MNANSDILSDGTLLLKQPRRLPDILDLLIVGGGPAGTAAAFRAKELGLAGLVVDFDDLMKRIRDYAKDKLILPDYGGGDNMSFPKGDGLIALLHFSPIDKDEMCQHWKKFYRDHSIPAQVGIELLGLQRRDAVWQARTYNHHTKAEQIYFAKHVLLAIGRGVPRRFDIPGNTEGMAYRLSDPALYIGAPALVIGGGTSAAEAVIAVSHAKIKANDATAVYWSYRGDKLPKVSKALAEAFFEAYMGNGNIRHYPYSEPVGMTAAEDKKDYLSLCTDRRSMAGRPRETSHLEFAKEHCIACIGEDIPTAFLSSLGIDMVAGGPGNKQRFVVTPLLETPQPNLYLIGDILSPAYWETENFEAEPTTFQEIRRRGNIKAALRDGVLVAEAVAQKLAGKKVIRVDLDFQEERPQPQFAAAKTSIVESDGPPKESFAAARFSQEHQAFLIRLLSGNVEAEEFVVNKNGLTTIGRQDCDLNFSDDMLLSGRHASISHGPEGYFLRDDGSTNGVFAKIKEARPVEILHGNIVRLGKQMLLFDAENGGHSFIHIDAAGKPLNRYELSAKTLVLGREAPDINLNPADMTLSRRHLSVTVKDRKIWVKDLGSANGSYLKIKNSAPLEPGDQFRAGHQIFKFSLKDEVTRRTIVFNTEVRSLRSEAKSPKSEVGIPKPEVRSPKPEIRSREAEVIKPQAAKPEGLVVVFKNFGKSCPFKPGQTICEIAEKNGLKFKADCRIGSCGIDPVRIVAGLENMNAVGDEEQGTLEDINKLEPGKYRLACVAKPRGPVVVEILEQK